MREVGEGWTETETDRQRTEKLRQTETQREIGAGKQRDRTTGIQA